MPPRVTLTVNIAESKTEKAWKSHRTSYKHVFESTHDLWGRPIVWSHLADRVLGKHSRSPGSSFPVLHCRREAGIFVESSPCMPQRCCIHKMLLLIMLPSSYYKDVCGPCTIMLLHRARLLSATYPPTHKLTCFVYKSRTVGLPTQYSCWKSYAAS